MSKWILFLKIFRLTRSRHCWAFLRGTFSSQSREAMVSNCGASLKKSNPNRTIQASKCGSINDYLSGIFPNLSVSTYSDARRPHFGGMKTQDSEILATFVPVSFSF